MVSNSLSRRRHVIASPEICKKPPPPPLPPYPPGGCTCNVGPLWHQSDLTLSITCTSTLATLPPGDPIEIWFNSTPPLAFANPYAWQNYSPHTTGPWTLPPGTPFFTITAGVKFSTGRLCSAHAAIDTPGA